MRRRISATASMGVSTGLRRSRWRAVVAASQLKSPIAASRVGKSDGVVDDVVGAGGGNARLLVRPAVARRDEAQVIEAEVGHGARHHADVVGELRLHQQHRGRLALAGKGRAAQTGPADAVAQLAQYAARPEPIAFPAPSRSQRLQAVDVQILLALAGDAHRAAADDDLAIALDEAVEAGDALGLDALGATGAGRRVGDAALLGAVDEDRLERVAVEAVDGEFGKPDVDGPLMADADHLRDGGAALQNQRHAAAFGICSNADGQVQLRRLCYLVAAQHRG